MPDGILPNEGIADQLVYLVQSPIAGVLESQCRLWVNDFTPDKDTVLADLQEATFSGYVRKTVPRADWQTPTVTDGCATSVNGTMPLQWTVTAATTEKVYGYALVDVLAGVIRFVQRLEPDDIQPLAVGNVLKLLPQYTLTSAACPGA